MKSTHTSGHSVGACLPKSAEMLAAASSLACHTNMATTGEELVTQHVQVAWDVLPATGGCCLVLSLSDCMGCAAQHRSTLPLYSLWVADSPVQQCPHGTQL